MKLKLFLILSIIKLSFAYKEEVAKDTTQTKQLEDEQETIERQIERLLDNKAEDNKDDDDRDDFQNSDSLSSDRRRRGGYAGDAKEKKDSLDVHGRRRHYAKGKKDSLSSDTRRRGGYAGDAKETKDSMSSDSRRRRGQFGDAKEKKDSFKEHSRRRYRAKGKKDSVNSDSRSERYGGGQGGGGYGDAKGKEEKEKTEDFKPATSDQNLNDVFEAVKFQLYARKIEADEKGRQYSDEYVPVSAQLYLKKDD